MPTVELFLFFPFEPAIFAVMWATAVVFIGMFIAKFILGLATPFSGN